MAENHTTKSDTLAATDEKAPPQPGRFLTPQPANTLNKKKAIQDLDYHPTPAPATVTVHKVSAQSKDPCWVGCILACFICCLVKDEPRS